MVVKYLYDAWGNCTISSETTNYTLAAANPIRYRGYYYDHDTGLYYLNARYYSPKWRRFVSPDETTYLDPESVNGLNLYCYCNNDPVNFVDPSGNSAFLVALSVLAVAGFVATGIGVATDNNMLTAIGLTAVAIPAMISGGLALSLATPVGFLVGGITCVAGAGAGLFASAEYQEAFTDTNWMLDAGLSEELYNGLMLLTAGVATLGTVASSVSSAFNIKSIEGAGKYGDYYGMRFQTSAGKTRVLSFHTHGHKVKHGIKSVFEWHWQLQKWNPLKAKTAGTIASWLWWNLTRL